MRINLEIGYIDYTNYEGKRWILTRIFEDGYSLKFTTREKAIEYVIERLDVVNILFVQDESKKVVGIYDNERLKILMEGYDVFSA